MSSVKVDNEPAPGVYAPRRSQRVSTDLAPSDGDIWQEKLAVCEGASPTGEPKLLIRSFYRNSRTRERVWDEPPSGAGTVLYATSDMRKTAEMQKQELQLTLEMIAPEEQDGGDDNKNLDSPDSSKKGKKKKLFSRFQKKNKKEQKQKQVDTSKDLNLQRAIARSMADQQRGSGNFDDPIVYYDGESTNDLATTLGVNVDDDEEMALAKALSMSAVESEQASPHIDGDTLTEEEMFQRALEQSKMESRNSAATGVASLPAGDLQNSFSSFTASPNPPRKGFVGKSDPNEDSDSKLPALSLNEKQPAQKFDPYG